MRFFKNCLEMIKEVERDLFEMGITYQSQTVQDKDVSKNKYFKTIELAGYSYKILEPEKAKIKQMIDYIFKKEKNILDWIEQEFNERINPLLFNPGEAYKLYALWNEYLHDNKFSYTYNERIRDQLDNIIKILEHNKNSRQCVITIYDKHLDINNIGGIKRIPCSMYYQLLIRQNYLYLIYNMRSCDFLKHFALDVALAIKLQLYIKSKIKGINLGNFTHFIGSLHAFRGDMEKRNIF
ncbi:MAG: thymidylate synthase [Candidatus Hodarchaeota archaeon]